MAMNMLLNPANDRQRRTRGALAAAASYAAGAAARRMFDNTIPRPMRQPSVVQVIRQSHEAKNYDQAATGLAISGTAYTRFILNSIDQGTTGTNRTGRKVFMERLEGRIILQKTTTVSVDTVRIVVFLDPECRGSSAGTNELLAVNTFGYGALSSLYNFDTVPSRFKVLLDRTVTLGATAPGNSGVTTWASPDHVVNFSLPIKKTATYYNTTGGGIADIESNSLTILVFGAQATGSASIMDYYLRTVFRDL